MIYVPVQHKLEEKANPCQNVKHNEPHCTILKHVKHLNSLFFRDFFD
jgi:hypothetical protein